MNGFQVISEQSELRADADFCIKELFTNTEEIRILLQWSIHQNVQQ